MISDTRAGPSEPAGQLRQEDPDSELTKAADWTGAVARREEVALKQKRQTHATVQCFVFGTPA